VPHRTRLVLLALLLAACAAPAGSLLGRVAYPRTATVTQVDDYHGTRVADPYRWLEDDRSAQTAAWVAQQNALTESVLARLPQRAELTERLTELWNTERLTPPARHGALWSWSRNDGLQPQNVTVVGSEPGVEERVLLDPNAWSADGTVALGSESWTVDGSLLACTIAQAGSDWQQIRVFEAATGAERPDRIDFVKFSTPAWRADGAGFFYSRFPAPEPGAELTAGNENMSVHYHALGTPQDADVLVHQDAAHPKWSFNARPTEDGRWLLLSTRSGTPGRNLLHVRPLDEPAAPFLALDDTWDTQVRCVGNDGPLFYCLTTWEAPRGRLVEIDARDPDRARWKTLVAEGDATLEDARLFGDTLVLTRLRDAHHVVTLADLRGEGEEPLTLPGLGTVSGFDGTRAQTETCFSFASFTDPGAIWRLDVPRAATSVVFRPQVAFDPEDFETEQVSVTSRDGTRVPMFLVHARGLEPDGQRPVTLYGYGGFDVSLRPAYSPALIPLLERGGVWAQPSLRGGGEFGAGWHEAGMLERKQNVFDDFIASAEWLIAQGWTSPGRLAISGRSNGGLLVGAAMTQRPELFGCALPGVGVMDMLRYHRFTIGSAWAGEYGTADDPGQFRALAAYSPLHRLRQGTRYPPTLVLTADHDDRVVPAHSFKFAAALQAAQGGEGPVLIRIESSAGHGSGKPVAKRISEAADTLAFQLAALGVP
jgi:prolyl oligopeptidase